jgi:hypothetical protein
MATLCGKGVGNGYGETGTRQVLQNTYEQQITTPTFDQL